MHGWRARLWLCVFVAHLNEVCASLRLLVLESRLQCRDRLRSQQLVANHPVGGVVEGGHGESVFAAIVLLQAGEQKIDDGFARSAKTILTERKVTSTTGQAVVAHVENVSGRDARDCKFDALPNAAAAGSDLDVEFRAWRRVAEAHAAGDINRKHAAPHKHTNNGRITGMRFDSWGQSRI